MSEVLATYDAVALTSALMLFVVYHADFFYVKPRLLGGQAPFAANLANIKIWLLNHQEKSNDSQEKSNLLAIQTVRNTMKAGVFIGGKALYITYLVSNGYSDMRSQRLKVRSLIISVLMFCSFLCWANVIRLGSSVGYYLGVLKYADQLRSQIVKRENDDASNVLNTVKSEPSNSGSPCDNISVSTRAGDVTPLKGTGQSETTTNLDSSEIPNPLHECITMLRMMILYAGVGFRLMFVAIPFALYSAGPTPLLITSVCVFVYIRHLDGAWHYKSKVKKRA